jgi:carbamoyl-phosphate synthase large subunit
MFLGAVMEHIEEAGIHSGDSACVLPPVTLGHSEIDRVRASTEAIALSSVKSVVVTRMVVAGRLP